MNPHIAPSNADALAQATSADSFTRTAGRGRSRFARLGAVLAVSAVLAAACAPDDEEPVAAEQTQTTTAETTDTTEATETESETEGGEQAGGMEQVSVETPAAELQAGLTSLLQEHVYLAGLAINQAVADGGNMEAPGTAAAVQTLDANSVALSEALASVYGDEAGQQFLALWRDHIGMFVQYTLGGATGDTAGQEAARQELDAYRAEFGAFIESATGGELSADAVGEELQVHVETLIGAIDAVLAGSPEVYPELRTAAGHMPHTAQALAGAIAAQQELEGEVGSPASQLRADLTHLLQEHVYLAGAAIAQAVADGGNMEAPGTKSAVETLDANSVALSEAVASVYGDEAGQQFLALWRDHIGMFVQYTLGGATGDTQAQEAARQELDAYRAEFGAFIDSATGGELPGDAVAQELQVHVETLIAAIDSVLAGSPEVYPQLQTAAQHMPHVAKALAGAIVAQQPEMFSA